MAQSSPPSNSTDTSDPDEAAGPERLLRRMSPPQFIAFSASFTAAIVTISYLAYIAGSAIGTIRGTALWQWALATIITALIFYPIAWIAFSDIRDDRKRLAKLRADSLPERAKRAAQVLQEATGLVEELQAELTARTALLEDVRRQAAESTERAADMEKLASVDDETTRILNRYFDKALKRRLEDLEQNARSREWLIGTVVAVPMGILVILIAHFALGF